MPCKVKLLRAASRKDTTPFTSEEITRVMAVAEPRVPALLAITASSGLQTSEILWLRWEDLEPNRALHLRPNVDRVRRRGERAEVAWFPKSHQTRSAFLPPATLGKLVRYRTELADERSRRRRPWPEDPWMFPGKRRRDARWGISAREPLRRAFEAAGCYEPAA